MPKVAAHGRLALMHRSRQKRRLPMALYAAFLGSKPYQGVGTVNRLNAHDSPNWRHRGGRPDLLSGVNRPLQHK
jgi:hypothetical protein